MTKRTSIFLDETDHRALRALQARYQLATAHEALRFALRAWDGLPAQRLDTTHLQELEEPPSAKRKRQQFAERVVHDLQGPLFVVRTVLELLSSCPPDDRKAKSKKLLESGMAGMRLLQAVMDQLRASTQGSAQESSSLHWHSKASQQSQRCASPCTRSSGPRAALAAKRRASSRSSHRKK